MRLEVGFQAPVVWIGNLNFADRAKKLAKSSTPAHDFAEGLAVRTHEWSLTLELFDHEPTADELAEIAPVPGAGKPFTTGTGSTALIADQDHLGLRDAFYVLDLKERSVLELPMSSSQTSLHWRWFAEGDVTFLVVIWSTDLTI